MTISYRASLKTTRMQDVLDDIDSDASAAFIEICSAAYAAVLATIVLAQPAGVVSGAVLTFDMPRTDASADNSGTAAIARVKNGAGVVIAQGLTCGTSGTDIIMSSVTITAGQSVTINSGTITHSA